MNRKENVVRMVKSVVLAYVLTAIILLIVSFIMYRCKISMNTANAGIMITYIVSCLVGGFVYSGGVEKRRYLGGGLLGVVYFAIVYGISVWWNRGLVEFMPGMLTTMAICVLSGMLGGMLRAGLK